MSANTTSQDALARLAAVIESRKAANGGDPNASYVARLLSKGAGEGRVALAWPVLRRATNVR